MPSSTEEPLLSGDKPNGAAGLLRSKSLQVRIQQLKERLEKPDHVTMLALALLFGVIAGVVAFVYNTYFEGLLWIVWEVIPEKLVQPTLQHAHDHLGLPSPDRLGWIYTVVMATSMGALAGVTQLFLGCPGDLPDTVRCIHRKGSIPIRQAPSMFICSAFSIAAGEVPETSMEFQRCFRVLSHLSACVLLLFCLHR